MLIPLYAVLGLAGLIVVLWLVYSFLLPTPESLLPDRLAGDLDETADSFLESAAANLDAPLAADNDIELLINGNQIFPAMLSAIQNARRSINFLTFVYWTGDIARRMADALSDAARRGIEVRVLLDAYGAMKMNDAVGEQLEAAGVHVAWFHPLRWYHLKRLNNRTHRKIMVVDGRVGFTGGVGIAEEWDGNARDESEWRDNHFRLEGPIVRYLQGSFADNWLDATGEVLAGSSLYPGLEPAGSTRIMPLTTSPRGDLSPVGFLYWMALCVARERVDIATPYFLPDRSVSDAIRATAARGVRIRLLVPDDHNDTSLLRAASIMHYPILLDGDVEIHEFAVSMMHTKMMIVDDRWAIVGSANFDNRSFQLNDEITLLVEDRDFVDRLGESFEADLGRSRRIERKDLEQRSIFERAKSRLALILRQQL